MPGGRHGFVIGDVSGHGVGQSLIMSEVRSALRSLVKTEHDLGKILASINRRLLDDAPDEIFVTLMIVQLDPETMHYTYATAGHAGLLIRPNGTYEELRSESLALGLTREARYTTSSSRAFHVGETLLMTTDGLEERHSPANELFGRTRMIHEVQVAGSCTSEQLIRRLIDAATSFSRGVRQHDDVTMVVIRRTDSSGDMRSAGERSYDAQHPHRVTAPPPHPPANDRVRSPHS
ncbi:MAG: serine/threonine-protein phosphatase [Planctomycetaceae bacterium]|nr:serine/threonine-protein phosphatase [Planctomycetaceae bacterium]